MPSVRAVKLRIAALSGANINLGIWYSFEKLSKHRVQLVGSYMDCRIVFGLKMLSCFVYLGFSDVDVLEKAWKKRGPQWHIHAKRSDAKEVFQTSVLDEKGSLKIFCSPKRLEGSSAKASDAVSEFLCG